MKSYKSEFEMYPDVMRWLKKFLVGRIDVSEVEVFDTHDMFLSSFLPNNGYTEMDYPTYEVKADITAVFDKGGSTRLAIVECKLNHIKLIDVAQIIGYSRITKPEYSFIISPHGPNDSLIRLFTNYNRTDILEYIDQKYITVAKFEGDRLDLNYNNLYPRGNL